MLRLAGLASRRRSQLSSNVRRTANMHRCLRLALVPLARLAGSSCLVTSCPPRACTRAALASVRSSRFGWAVHAGQTALPFPERVFGSRRAGSLLVRSSRLTPRHRTLFLPAVPSLTAPPNPSLKLTRYGTQRKPGPLALRHHRVPGLRCAPPRAA
jgi:hypothetical protein